MADPTPIRRVGAATITASSGTLTAGTATVTVSTDVVEVTFVDFTITDSDGGHEGYRAGWRYNNRHRYGNSR